MHCCDNGAHTSCICILLFPLPRIPLTALSQTEVSKSGRKLNICDSASCRRPTLFETSFVGEEQIIFYNINHPTSSHLKL